MISYQKGQRIEVTLSDLAESDALFGRLDDGMSVFVERRSGMPPLAIGDTVEAEIAKVKSRYVTAFFREMKHPSSLRRDALCSHFGVCGGCKWQHLTYESAVMLKEKKVRDALKHIGGFEAVPFLPPIASPREFGYRNKVEFSFCDKRFLLPDEPPNSLTKPDNFALGFHAPERYDKVIDIDRCHIGTEDMSTALRVVKEIALVSGEVPYSTKTHTGFWRHLMVRHAVHTDEVMINVVTSTYNEHLMSSISEKIRQALGEKVVSIVNNLTSSKSNVSFGEKEIVVYGKAFITERLGKYAYQISANSFFQTNTRGAEALYEVVLAFLELTGNETVFDFYSGTGSISIYVSSYATSVVGVELVESSIRDAEANAERNGVKNCAFYRWDMAKANDLLDRISQRPDVIITDPPRAGMHPDAINSMLSLRPHRIVYVSCNPASLARDAKCITETAPYDLVKVRAVDLFPHTNHIESVALFVKREG